jgi:hypothetical protein
MLLKLSFFLRPKTIFFAGCFDTITYVHCLVNGYLPSNAIWSTTSIPLRIPLLHVRPGDLAFGAGYQSAGGAQFGLIEIYLFFCESNKYCRLSRWWVAISTHN